MSSGSSPLSDASDSLPTTAPSSPPDMQKTVAVEEMSYLDEDAERKLEEEEEKARRINEQAQRKEAATRKRRVKKTDSALRDEQAQRLDELLAKSAAFSDILTKKTQALGRVGTGLDGKTLGEHNLEMAKQPKIMRGGTMRDYQLEGLTWMYEICFQGLSGILADEMGLGKTIQTISLIALLREKDNYMGPHLIVAPLSTLSNWIEEFQKWTPSVPVVLYHGTPAQREELRKTKIIKHLDKNGRPTDKFPVVCTSYDIILRDRSHLTRVKWEFIIIDEGHRLKNFDSALFRELRSFTSASRLLITGTPLQNNLKELWSLLYFLLPNVFTTWEAFESWFDFSGLEDEEGTEEFIADAKKQDLVKKIHMILQPLLLRRIKADVEHMLPKKREYVLYAPMTEEQMELYRIMSDKKADARKFLEDKVVERLTGTRNTPLTSRKASPIANVEKTKVESESEEEQPLKLALRNRQRVADTTDSMESPKGNAFAKMMAKRGDAGRDTRSSKKRKSSDSLDVLDTTVKSARSSRNSTPASSVRGSTRRTKVQKTYAEADASDEDELTDEAFEEKLANELTNDQPDSEDLLVDDEESERVKTLEMAKKEISTKKLGNPLMQLRLVCNSPHNFYNPWNSDTELPVDESLVTQSGKMLLLDRLLPELFSRGHKVLIFSQFKTQLDIIEDYARDLRGWNICRIDGSVAQDDRRKQIKSFNTDPDFRLFLLSTRAGGQGINLASADTVILFDSDWNPQQDLQAIDRAHRIGQTRPVVTFRFATKGTVEEELLMSADAKRRLEKLVIKKGGFKTLANKMDASEDQVEKDLRALLLKDGEVFHYTGKEEILSDQDLDTLCDRSNEAYIKAEKGLGNAAGFTVIETKANGLMTDMSK